MTITQEYQKQPDEVLDRKSTAQLLGGICLTTLSRLDLPRIKIRRRVFYKRSEVLAYINSKTEAKPKEGLLCNQ